MKLSIFIICLLVLFTCVAGVQRSHRRHHRRSHLKALIQHHRHHHSHRHQLKTFKSLITRVSHKMYMRAHAKMSAQLQFMYKFKLQKKFFENESIDTDANLQLKKIADHLAAGMDRQETKALGSLKFTGFYDYFDAKDKKNTSPKAQASEIGQMLKQFRDKTGISQEFVDSNNEYKNFLQFFEYSYGTVYELEENAKTLAKCKLATDSDFILVDNQDLMQDVEANKAQIVQILQKNNQSQRIVDDWLQCVKEIKKTDKSKIDPHEEAENEVKESEVDNDSLTINEENWTKIQQVKAYAKEVYQKMVDYNEDLKENFMNEVIDNTPGFKDRSRFHKQSDALKKKFEHLNYFKKAEIPNFCWLNQRKDLDCKSKNTEPNPAAVISYFKTGIFNGCWETCYTVSSGNKPGRRIDDCSTHGYWKWQGSSWWPYNLQSTEFADKPCGTTPAGTPLRRTTHWGWSVCQLSDNAECSDMGLVNCNYALMSGCSTDRTQCRKQQYAFTMAIIKGLVQFIGTVFFPGGNLILKIIDVAIKVVEAISSLIDALQKLLDDGKGMYKLMKEHPIAFKTRINKAARLYKSKLDAEGDIRPQLDIAKEIYKTVTDALNSYGANGDAEFEKHVKELSQQVEAKNKDTGFWDNAKQKMAEVQESSAAQVAERVYAAEQGLETIQKTAKGIKDSVDAVSDFMNQSAAEAAFTAQQNSQNPLSNIGSAFMDKFDGFDGSTSKTDSVGKTTTSKNDFTQWAGVATQVFAGVKVLYTIGESAVRKPTNLEEDQAHNAATIQSVRDYTAALDPTGLLSMFNAFVKDDCPVFDTIGNSGDPSS